MIVDDRITSYINSLYREEDVFICELEKEALANDVPIVRKETRHWLKTMLLIKRPKNVLEVGTAIGFSSIYMSRYIPADGHITTIENWRPRIQQAYVNFEKAGVTDKVTLIEGDAVDVLAGMKGLYDFVFMDAAKGQYINYLPDVIRLMEKGGILISDNVLQNGDITDSRFVVERRDRTIHKRMRDYLYELEHNDELDSSVIPLGDGVAISVKNRG